MDWNPPRKYKGLRTQWVHAIKITIPYPELDYGRSLGAIMTRRLPWAMLAEMEQWCEDNCQHNWSSSGFTTWYFDKMQEALMFKMIFGGK